jgi:hypothetical protein
MAWVRAHRRHGSLRVRDLGVDGGPRRSRRGLGRRSLGTRRGERGLGCRCCRAQRGVRGGRSRLGGRHHKSAAQRRAGGPVYTTGSRLGARGPARARANAERNELALVSRARYTRYYRTTRALLCTKYRII